MLFRRIDQVRTATYVELDDLLAPGELLAEPPKGWAGDWAAAGPDSFARV